MQGRFSQAKSDVPIYLHRALELPLLAVEIDTRPRIDGGRAERMVSLRATAPVNTELARRLEKLSEQDEMPSDSIKSFIALFKDIPVLWLETNHYTAYLPKWMTQSVDATSLPLEQISSDKTPTLPPTPTHLQRLYNFVSGSS